METGLEGKRALVCGASRGLGFACAKALCREGARVVLLSRNEEALRERVEYLKGQGWEASYVVGDLARTEGIQQLAERARLKYGGVDILVNNAGGPPAGDNLSFTYQQWEESFRLTFLSAEEMTKHLILDMAERGWGRVINLTSITVRQPVTGLILSNSIRMAVVGWAKTLSLEFAGSGVTVNNIATGYTLTERIEELATSRAEKSGKTVQEEIESMAAQIPMKRMADPDEIASVVAFLASSKASYITGSTIAVDGGYIIGM